MSSKRRRGVESATVRSFSLRVTVGLIGRLALSVPVCLFMLSLVASFMWSPALLLLLLGDADTPAVDITAALTVLLLLLMPLPLLLALPLGDVLASAADTCAIALRLLW